MEEINNNYPKSSCNCYNCDKNKYTIKSVGKPTSISVRECEVPNYYECYDKKLFKEQIEPRNISGFIELNPFCMNKNFDKSFEKIECKDECLNGNPKIIYASTDPRLISPMHSGQILTLDRPPVNENIKLADIYTDPNMKYYGEKYTSYSDINAGQINYYIDRSIEDAFYQPIFENNAYVKGELYKDPMDSMKPQYNRTPVYNDNFLNTKRKNYRGKLSWIEDSNEQREDIMALQQRKNNQMKYSSRWTGNISL
jgi:hypothetical protein